MHDEENEKRNNGDDAQDLNHDDSPSAAMASTLLTRGQIGIVDAHLSRSHSAGAADGPGGLVTRPFTRVGAP